MDWLLHYNLIWSKLKSSRYVSKKSVTDVYRWQKEWLNRPALFYCLSCVSGCCLEGAALKCNHNSHVLVLLAHILLVNINLIYKIKKIYISTWQFTSISAPIGLKPCSHWWDHWRMASYCIKLCCLHSRCWSLQIS